MDKYITHNGIKIATDFVPETFGRLTTIGPRFMLNRRGRHIAFQVAICCCGNYKVCRYGDMQSGRIASCRCLQKETVAKLNYSHGETNTAKEYSAWRSMKSRCYNSNIKGFHRYGGRGIRVCDRWREPDGQGYLNFVADMGRCPPECNSVDRENLDGNYEPGNCRWATVEQQNENTSTNVYLTAFGETKCASRWSKDLGIPYRPILRKLKRGIPHEQCLDPKIK